MVLENYESDELDVLINKSQELTKQFESYCLKHNKEFLTSFSMTATGLEIFKLEIKIKDRNEKRK